MVPCYLLVYNAFASFLKIIARMLTPTADDTRDYEADREEEDEISSTTFSGGKR